MRKVTKEIFPLQEAILDGLKELARIGLIAILPIIIVQLEAGKIDLKVLWVLFVVAVLKAIDRGLHSFGKDTNNEGLTKGLVRF